MIAGSGPARRRTSTWARISGGVFLIFKEAISNAARHSGASHVNIRFEMHAGRLALEVSDDGKESMKQ